MVLRPAFKHYEIDPWSVLMTSHNVIYRGNALYSLTEPELESESLSI